MYPPPSQQLITLIAHGTQDTQNISRGLVVHFGGARPSSSSARTYSARACATAPFCVEANVRGSLTQSVGRETRRVTATPTYSLVFNSAVPSYPPPLQKVDPTKVRDFFFFFVRWKGVAGRSLRSPLARVCFTDNKKLTSRGWRLISDKKINK